jgi:hypothetical protein
MAWRMARHLGNEPVLIQALVDVGIAQVILYRDVQVWISQRNAPNLYWAPRRLDQITDLPVPPNPLTGKPFSYRMEGQAAITGRADAHGASRRLGSEV